MNRCPITYAWCGDQKYSKSGLKLLSPRLKFLHNFPYTNKEMLNQAKALADKLSIQGVQPKLSAKINITKALFEIVHFKGKYILKPPQLEYEELPQNEDLTMRLASLVGLNVPFHGMIYNNENELIYFIKRFDRLPKNQKLAVEDFTQLLGEGRDTKYNSSMEKLATYIENMCTFPPLEKIKLFRLTLFNFLVGNEDMHLKNFSLITREGVIELSPVYDLLNSTIVMNKAKEELALTLNGKKSNFNREDFIEYFGKERLKLDEKIINNELSNFQSQLPNMQDLIENSFLSPDMQHKYISLLKDRSKRLGF